MAEENSLICERHASKLQVLGALFANQNFQNKLEEHLQAIKHSKQRNSEMQNRISELCQQDEKTLYLPTPEKKQENHFGPPFFVDRNGSIPLDNEDTIKNLKNPPPFPKSRRWSHAERNTLRTAIKERNMRLIAEKNMAEGRPFDLVTKYKDSIILRESKDLADDFPELAKKYLPNRTPAECFIQWINNDHPLINKESWSQEESKKLRMLVKGQKSVNWQQIALELGDTRNAISCFKEWKRQSIPRRKWAKEEDQKLIRAVSMYGEGNWQQVAHCFDNRTGQQCLHRWTKTLSPIRKTGRWSAKEDELLKQAVLLHGPKNWVKLQQYVPGRTDVQCRERWKNVLDSSIKKDKWHPEEDEKLSQFVNEFGKNQWSRISKELNNGRTDNQCRRRYLQLNKKTVETKK
ncbi:12230_t:CDS:10 [Ambispora gerdemannii]|uniref:12230_t:CDS:1 n=1 Tax=Ambispora gerdemannii TaxID=144530 RepID=A0A9N9FBJ7_9GLOM|nr:12230_t:CDS:10 [Ambispora gerdemannii]